MSPHKFAPTAQYIALSEQEPVTVVISFSLVTSDGVSNSAGHSTVVLEHYQSATFYPPFIPEEATGWIPEYINEQGVRTALGVLSVTDSATLAASDVTAGVGVPRTVLLEQLSGGSNPMALSADTFNTSGAASTGLVDLAQPEMQTVTIGGLDPSLYPGGITPDGANPLQPGIAGTPAAQDGAASQDGTGITPPDAELDGVVAIGTALPTPGPYQVRLTKLSIDPDDDSEDESAPGPLATMDVPSGKYLRVKTPRESGNWIPNPELSARRNAAALKPSDWEYPAIQGVEVRTDIPGVQEFEDETLSIADVDIIRTAKIDVSILPTVTNRIVIEIPEQTSGRIDYVLREQLADATVKDTVLVSASSEATHDIINRIGGPGVTGVDLTWTTGVVKAQFVIRLIGSSVAGPRNLSAKIKHPGMVSGKTIPRKRVRQRRREVRALPAFGTPIGRPSASPISYVGDTKKTTSTPGLTAFCDRPSGAIAGDLVLAWVQLGFAADTTTITAPSGWVPVGDTVHPMIGRQTLYRKILTDSEPDNYTFSWSTSTSSLIVIQAYTGVNPDSPIDTTASNAGLVYQTNVDAPPVNVTASRAVVIAAFGSTQSQAWTHPSGMTERVDIHDSAFAPSMSISDVVQISPGDSGTRTATADSTLFGMARTVALRPANVTAPAPTTEVNFRAATSADNHTSTLGDTSGAVAKPTGVVADDLLILAINLKSTSAITPPAGFTQAVNSTYPTASPESRLAVYYKKAGGSEGSSYTFSWTGAASYVAEMVAYSGVDTTTALDVAASLSQTATQTNEIACPSVSTSSTATRVVCVYAAASSYGGSPFGLGYYLGFGTGFGEGSTPDNWTAPTGMTERADTAGLAPLSISDVAQAASGPTGTKTATSGIYGFLAGATLALRPVIVTPSPPPPSPPPPPPPVASLLPPPLLPRQVAPVVEEPGAPYPTYGYTKVILSEGISDAERPIWTTGPTTYIPGNMVEFYAPPGIPVISSFFMTGLKMPVKPEEVRTLSYHFWYQGVEQPSTPFKVLLKDMKHRLLEDFGAFEDLLDITGDSADELDADANGFVRRSITVDIPPANPNLDKTHEPAYIEIVAAGCGGGLFRVMGGQNELGTNMTPFDLSHDLSGTLTNVFDLWLPGIPHGSMSTLAEISRFIRIAAEITHVGPTLETPLTSHVVEARTRNYTDPDIEASWSDWTSDPAMLPIPPDGGYVMLRTTISTIDTLVSPILHSQYIEFERDNPHGSAYGSLCRADGTEFDGGVVVYGFPPVRPQKPLITEEFADRTHGFSVMGKQTRWARGFGIQAYTNFTAEEIMELLGADPTDDPSRASVFCIEVYGKRYAARIIDLELTSEEREAHLPLPNLELNGMWLLFAEDIEAEILGEEIF